MTQLPVTKRFYPALSEVITEDDLPEFLHFAEQGLGVVLQNIYYKNLQYSKSYRGDAAFYSLDIISKNIGIDLPFGLRFVLNPDVDGDTSISSFPISLEYQWEVLAFLRSFNIQNFAYTPNAFFELGLQIFRITDAEVIAQSINYFIDTGTTGTSKYTQLVADINVEYPSANLTLPSGQEPTPDLIAELITQNSNIPDTVSEALFSIYVLEADPSRTGTNLRRFFSLMVPEGIEQYIRHLLIPKVRASLTLSAAIEFPNTVLRPVDASGQPLPGKSLFKFVEATFYADTESGIGTELEIAGSLIPEFNEIGNTGLIIGFTGAKLDLSRTTNIPEADAAGYPVDFMGLYVKHATISFQRFGEDVAGSGIVSADNLFIGTGGLSGALTLQSGSNPLLRKFRKFEVELDIFSVTFRLNSIISSNIKGKLKLKKWKQGGQDAIIDIEAHFQDNGDFNITALTDQVIPPLTLPGVLEINIVAFSFGKEDDRFYIEVAGILSFIANVPVLGDVLPKGIEVKGLRIWDDGDLEFRGGSLVIPKAFKLSIGPVNLEVTNMSTGSHHRNHLNVDRVYKFFGFDGMINTGRAGVNATGNGIKFYYTNDDGPFDCFLSIDKMTIDMTIPANVEKDDAAFILNGYLSMKNPDPAISGSAAGHEYSGAVSFTMPRLKMAGSAGMRLNPAVPSFVVDIGLELSTPVPLGATGLGIYGFRGLIGQHYLPSKAATTPPLGEDASWWDYYKVPSTFTHKEGIEIDKFADKPGYSVGAGVSIATAFDSGKVFSSKLFLLLGMPNVFLLQGQAGILRSRIGLTDDVDPPFSALVSIDNNSFRGNLRVNYRLPEGGGWIDGKILALSGTLDMAFFFNNASGWYLNIGKDQPESARIRAEILGLFRGYAYLMISLRGFKAGAGARFDFNKKYLGIAVGVGAWLDMGGSLSFKPIQIGAFIQIGGYAYLKVWKLKISLSVQISLAVEAPSPFYITGGINIKVRIWPIKLSFTLEITWRLNNDNALLAPLPVLELSRAESGNMPAVATNILTGETFKVNYIESDDAGNIHNYRLNDWKYDFTNNTEVVQVTVPMDSFIDIELLKPVRPTATAIGGAANQLPGGYSELLPPQKGISDQVSHSFELTGLEIYVWRESGGGSWQPYNIYEAVTAIVESNVGNNIINLSELKQGYWQFAEPNRYNKIRLLAQNMFSYKNETSSSASDVDAFNYRRNDLFCYGSVLKESVVDWTGEAFGTEYPEQFTGFVKGVSFLYDRLNARVGGRLITGSHILDVRANGGKIIISLPKAASTIALRFDINESEVKIDFLRKTSIAGNFGYAGQRYIVVNSSLLLATQQNLTLSYNDLAVPVDKIILNFKEENYLDFNGDFVIGGHFSLPDQYITSDNLPEHHELEQTRAMVRVVLFTRSFSVHEVFERQYESNSGKAGIWLMFSNEDLTGRFNGVITGSPDLVDGFYLEDWTGLKLFHKVYSFSGNSDSLLIPYRPALKVETGNFSFEVTVIMDPYSSGISTLLSKVNIDPLTGNKKGFALHLYQDTTADSALPYNNINDVPSFSIWFTCYQDGRSSGIKVSEKYSLDCATGVVSRRQFKHILVSVDRINGLVEIFINQVLKISVPVPSELALMTAQLRRTQIESLRYLSEDKQKRKEENRISREALTTESILLGNNLNKTIQPVWRPNTIFAVVVKTRDVVRKVGRDIESDLERTAIIGFKTAGPIGHFQQHSSAYQILASQDRAAEFKLATLKSYIDEERSFPDVQSRHDLSKPVFYQAAEVRLFFTKPYVNAMYHNWDSYQGLSAVESKLELQVLDPFGNSNSPTLSWRQLDIPVTMENYQILPPDQQVLFLMNAAANSEDGCGENPILFTKRIKNGKYSLDELLPDRLYTALFNAVYSTAEQGEQRTEVHKFNFKTSRFSSFDHQVGSFMNVGLPDNQHDAVYPILVHFTETEINQNLKSLIDGNIENDPTEVLRYAVKYDRLIYGGLGLKNLELIQTTVFHPIINIDPNDNSKRLLGLLIRNPEPFNDPKLSSGILADTVMLTVFGQSEGIFGPEVFVYIHSRDTSGVFITNIEMDLPVGQAKIQFRYKEFNGLNYDVYSPAACEIQLTKDF